MNSRIATAIAAIGVCVVAAQGTARADLFELTWSTEGYFRTRTVLLTNLARQPRRTLVHPGTGDTVVIPEIKSTSYVTSRLRLMPSLSYEKLASLHFQIDAVDDVVWGDNNGLSSAPLLATDVSDQHFLGGDVGDSVTIPRAWIQFQVPVGIMRVGRMPSHWGMGLLANGGGTMNMDALAPEHEPRKGLDHFFDDDFGDNHFGSTADRILFITKPLTIAKTIMKKKDVESNFVVGYAFDKISEAPFLAAEPPERRFRPFGQQGFLSRGSSDDVTEHVVLAVYNDADWDKVRYTDELRFGTYWVFRTQGESSTNPSELDPDEFCGEGVRCEDTGAFIWIGDIWWRVRYGSLYTEGEIYHIGGEAFGGIPFPAPNEPKEANITGGVARFGWLTDMYDGMLELGYSGGDDVLEDKEFTQRAINPDFNVSLILFEEIIRELSARTFGPPFFSDENPEGAKGLMSNGGVVNARYGSLRGRYRPGLAGLTLVGQVLAAWVDTPADTGTAMFYKYRDNPADPLNPIENSTFLGWEVDLAVKSNFAGDHMDFSLEAGYLNFGGALRTAFSPDGDPDNARATSSFSLQTRVAFLW